MIALVLLLILLAAYVARECVQQETTPWSWARSRWADLRAGNYGRVIRTNNDAWDLGLHAQRWRLYGRLMLLQSFHDPAAAHQEDNPEGIGPWRVYWFSGDLKEQLDEFCEGASK